MTSTIPSAFYTNYVVLFDIVGTLAMPWDLVEIINNL
jgi:hypothetical protein